MVRKSVHLRCCALGRTQTEAQPFLVLPQAHIAALIAPVGKLLYAVAYSGIFGSWFLTLLSGALVGMAFNPGTSTDLALPLNSFGMALCIVAAVKQGLGAILGRGGGRSAVFVVAGLSFAVSFSALRRECSCGGTVLMPFINNVMRTKKLNALAITLKAIFQRHALCNAAIAGSVAGWGVPFDATAVAWVAQTASSHVTYVTGRACDVTCAIHSLVGG